MKRNRLFYAFAIAAVIALGLASRRYAAWLPEFMAHHAGDTLWSLMVFLGIGWLAPRWPSRRVAIGAILFAFAIECSQLYHAPWIDEVRDLPLAGLVLGYEFVWSDLACYAAGVVFGFAVETFISSDLLSFPFRPGPKAAHRR